MQIETEVRRVITGGLRKGVNNAPALFLGENGHSQVQGDMAVRAAAGARFAAVMGNGSTFIGSVTAWPTTTLTMALYNNEPPGGKSLFLDRAWAVFISGTSALGAVLLVGVTADQQVKPTLSTGANGGYASTVISSLNGKGAPGGTHAALLNAITATGSQFAWFPVATWQGTNATTTIANQNLYSDDLKGGILVPPQYMAGIVVVEAAGTSPLWSYGFSWSEYQADLE